MLANVEIRDQVAQLDSEIGALQAELVQSQARLAGLTAQRASLAQVLAEQAEREQSTSSAAEKYNNIPDLAGRNRTDAILQVLGATEQAMSIEDVAGVLEAGGNGPQGYQVVASTLNYLYRQGRIEKPRRGRYSA